MQQIQLQDPAHVADIAQRLLEDGATEEQVHQVVEKLVYGDNGDTAKVAEDENE